MELLIIGLLIGHVSGLLMFRGIFKGLFTKRNRFDAKIVKPDGIVWGETSNGNKGLVMYLESEDKWIHGWQDASARPYIYIDVLWWANQLNEL